jgi:hypothetical protein
MTRNEPTPPQRAALVEAAHRTQSERLCAVDDLLATGALDVALAEWMDRFVDYAATTSRMSDALQSVVASSSAELSPTRARRVELAPGRLRARHARRDLVLIPPWHDSSSFTARFTAHGAGSRWSPRCRAPATPS